jgi:plasmid stabilization system protein ParE
MRRYRILPPAREELRSASRWYEQQRDGLGHALIDEFEERLALALKHPDAGAMVGSTTQGLPIWRHRLARFARYSILMFVDDDGTSTVLPFSHSSRDPIHWKDRVR